MTHAPEIKNTRLCLVSFTLSQSLATSRVQVSQHPACKSRNIPRAWTSLSCTQNHRQPNVMVACAQAHVAQARDCIVVLFPIIISYYTIPRLRHMCLCAGNHNIGLLWQNVFTNKWLTYFIFLAVFKAGAVITRLWLCPLPSL